MKQTTHEMFETIFQGLSGSISISLKNDLMLHKAASNSTEGLTSLICALKGLKKSDVKSISLLNPIDYNKMHSKAVILDIKVELNNEEYIDVELQCYVDKTWEQRSVLYLSRVYDKLEAGDDFSKLKKATLIGIMDYPLFPDHPEFYSRFYLTNQKTHYIYTSTFSINMLDLTHIELATEQDISDGLVAWAKMFTATTWEELRDAAAGDIGKEEVALIMYQSNMDVEERSLFEAHQKALELQLFLQRQAAEQEETIEKQRVEIESNHLILAERLKQIELTDKMLQSAQTKLTDTQKQLDDTQQQLDDKQQQLDDKQQQLDDKQQQLDDKQQEIHRLQQILKEHQISYI